MSFRWEVAIVQLDEAQEQGTGQWEPLTVIEDEDRGPCLVVKRFTEYATNGKASEE